jgi:hypothetical protein
MSQSGTALPPRAPRGEVSAQRTEGSWGGVSIESSIHLNSLQGLIDRFEYDFGPNQYVIVPEAQYPKTARSEKCVPTHVVVGLLGVLTSVQLDDDGSLEASEVADIGLDRMLSAEFESGQLTSTLTLPEDTLSTSRIFAKAARVAKHAPIDSLFAGINMAKYNLSGLRLMTPPALRATSPASLRRQAVVR